MRNTRPALPSQDKRWKIIDARMRRYGYRSHALIESLHTAQEVFGYLDEEVLKFAAVALRVPLSKVYGVATFYNFFNLRPPGQHTCVVCTGTACYIKGAPLILEAIEEVSGVKAGETSADGKVSVMSARCFGSCGLAPALTFDGEVAGKVTPAQAAERVRNWINA